MRNIRILIVVLATSTLVASEPQLFSFQLGTPPGDDEGSENADDTPSNSVESLPPQYRNAPPPRGKQSSRFPGVTFVSDSPEGEHKGSGGFLSSLIGGRGAPGPLNYGEVQNSGQSESEPEYQNDIASVYKNSGEGGSGSKPQVSEGYRPGPPPGYGGGGGGGSGRPRGPRPRGRFENVQQSLFAAFAPRRPQRGPRGPPSSSVSHSPSNEVGGGGYRQRSPTESLPVRIGRGLNGLMSMLTSGSNPSGMLSIRPNFFSPPTGPSGPSRPSRPSQMFASGSSPKDATLYLEPPQKDAPSFYGVRVHRPVKSGFRSIKSPLSLLTSETNNRIPQEYYLSSSRPSASAQQEQIVRHPQFQSGPRGPPRAPTYTIQGTNQFSSHPSQQQLISSSQPPQPQLVQGTGPDGEPVFYQISSGPQEQIVQHQPQPQEQILRQQPQPQPQQPQIQYVSQQNQGPLTLASRPDVPFPSLTHSHGPPSQYIQQSPVGQPQTSFSIAGGPAGPPPPQFVSQQGAFTVTGAKSIYQNPESHLFQAPIQQQSFDLSSIQDAQFQQVLLNQLNIDPSASQGVRNQHVQVLQPQPQHQHQQVQIRAQPQQLQQQPQQFIQTSAVSQNPTSASAEQVQLVKPSSPQQFRQQQQDAIGAFSSIEEQKEEESSSKP